MIRRVNSILRFSLTSVLIIIAVIVCWSSSGQASGGVDADNSAVTAQTTPAVPVVGMEFTFRVTVKDGADNPISGLGSEAFAITEDGAGSLTIAGITEDGATGSYTVAASYDAAETITITVRVSGIEVGSIANVSVHRIYHFNNLAAGALHGQDNWVEVLNPNNQAQQKHEVQVPAGIYLVPGHDGSKAARFLHEGSGVGSRVSRVNDGNFNFPTFNSGDIYVIEFEMAHAYWGSSFGLGYDANGNRDIDGNSEVGIKLMISGAGNTKSLTKPDGTVVQGTAPVLGPFNRYQIVLDQSAYGGAGAASVYFLDLTNEEAVWSPITGLQNLNMGFDFGLSSSNKNPSYWNGIRIQSEGMAPLFDNITVRRISPSARAVNFDKTAIGAASLPQTITFTGENLTGRLTASLTGDFVFADNSTRIEGLTSGSSLALKFMPDEPGISSGTLILQGEDMVVPITIPLGGEGEYPITRFDFAGLDPEVTGVIDQDAKTIILTVPYGTDVTTLIPTITYTGASISPGDSVAQDFSDPVVYTVTAPDSGTEQYTVTVNQLPAAGFGKALEFTDTGGISIPSTVRFAGSSDFTISMWFYPKQRDGDYAMIFRQYGGQPGQLGIWVRYMEDGKVGVSFDKLATGWQWITGNTVYEPGEWHHLAVTKAGKDIRIYANGVLDTAATMDDVRYTAALSTGTSYFGGGNQPEFPSFPGMMDEFQIWGAALPQAAIQDWMYREIDPTHLNYNDLILYYKLNEGSGAAAMDSKGSNHGNLLNMDGSNWVDSAIRGWATDEDTPFTGRLVGSRMDGSSSDGADWTLAFNIVEQAEKGAVQISAYNQFTYTPYENEHGSDTFSYKVFDGINYSNEYTVQVTVNPVNDAPSQPGAFTSPAAESIFNGDDSISVVWGASTDAESDPLTYTVDFYDGSNWIEEVYSGSGTSFTYSPPIGTDTSSAKFRIRANDGSLSSDYTESSEFVINTLCTVSFDSNGGSGVGGQTVDYNSTATEPEEPTRAGHTFVGWYSDSELASIFNFATPITGDITLHAKWDIHQYTLSYTAGENGNITGDITQTVSHGSDGTAVTAVPDEGYHFVGWSDGVATASRTDTDVTGNIAVTAVFAINEYMVIFKNWDGSSLKTETVSHGNGATAPAEPEREGYHFTGWDVGYSNVTSDITVTAVFVINEYTLTYSTGENGNVTGNTSQIVNHGSNGSEVEAVPDEGYHFVEWSDGVATASRTDTDVTGNIAVIATFAINEYTLAYSAGANGSINGNTSQIVNHGSNGSQVEAVPDEGYHFVEWSDGVATVSRTDTDVTENIAITATFAINTYTVTFKNWDGSSLKMETVGHGSGATAPAEPAREGYHFTGWDVECDNVTSDLTVTAGFVINEYTLAYSAGANGSISGNTSQIVNHGSNGSEVEAVPDEGYHFVEWSDGVATASRTDTDVTGNIAVTATFAINEYTVTFKNWDGSSLKTETVSYGSGATAPAEPAREGYYFTGWDAEYGNVKSDITVIATFAINEYTLTYGAGANGSISGNTSQTVNHGSDGSKVEAMPDEGYHFIGWSDGVDTASRTDIGVTANIAVTATFAINEYTLAYSAGANGSISGDTSQTVNHGSDGSEVEAVPDEGYHFVEWSDGVTTASRTDTAVTGNIAVTATFTINTYTVTFNSNGGSTSESQTVNYNTTAAEPAAPTKAGYTFDGWYADAVLNSAFNFDTLITEETVLYAKWINLGPTGALAINGGNPLTNSATVALTLSATDPEGDTVTDSSFSDDGVSWTAWEVYAADKTYVLPSGDGNKTVYVKFKDSKGSVGAPCSVSIELDTLLPVIAGVAGNTAYSIDVIPAFEEGTATLARDSGSAGAYTSGTAIGEEGNYELVLTDLAGNFTIVNFTIDKTAPVGTVSINSGDENTASTGVALTVESADGSGAGAVQMRFSNDGIAWSAWEAASASKTWTIQSEYGTATVYMQLKDGAGNISGNITDSILYKSVLVSESSTRNGSEDTALRLSEIDFKYSNADGSPLNKIMIISLPPHGALMLGDANISVSQEVYEADLDSLVFIPDDDWNGMTSFHWKGSDGINYSPPTAEIVLSIAAVNDAPEASNGSLTANAGATAGGTLSAGDADGDILTYSIVSQGGKGTVAITDAATGTYVYTPHPGAYGSDSFTFKVSDGSVASNTATVTVDIIPYETTAQPEDNSTGAEDSGIEPEGSGTGVEVLVNGKAENAGIATTVKEGEKIITTITVDEKKLEQELESAGSKSVVTIPAVTGADVVVGELNGQMVKNMEGKQAVVEVKTETAAYSLPAQQINIDGILAQIGGDVQLKDIKLQIEIVKSAVETARVVENSAGKDEFTIVAPPLDFTVRCIGGGKTIEISKFDVYVERTIAIPEGVDPSKITTAVVIEADGVVRHVPTKIIVADGKYYAKINSLTNSTYTVIWHPLEFRDVEKHWAKAAVNDMGSRMVAGGVGNGMFEPDRHITRAEFAAIVVRALGLKPGTGRNPFNDVKSEDWYCGFIETAYEYGIISGYGNGKFSPMDKITREQAMTMVSRAMKITGLQAELSDGEADKLLESFADANSAADYAKAGIAACIETGIVSGRSDTTIAPKDNITRAEVAVIVRRLLQKADLI